MNLQSHLENLRAKPEHIKKRYAFWSSFGFTAIIFAFWIASFSSWGMASAPAVASVVDKVGTPAQSMIAGVGSFFTDIKDLIFGAKKIKYTSVEVSPGKQ
jgi:hypothetical protein